MAINFDGSKYIALDDALFGDGSTDSTTKPVDTYIEKVLDNNIRYLRKNSGSSVTYTPFQENGSAGRWFTSTEKSTKMQTWWPVSKATTKIGCKVFADVDLPSGSVAQKLMFAHLEIKGSPNGPVYAKKRVEWDGSADNPLHTIEVDLEPLNLGSVDAQDVFVTLWISRSYPAETLDNGDDYNDKVYAIDPDSGTVDLTSHVEPRTEYSVLARNKARSKDVDIVGKFLDGVSSTQYLTPVVGTDFIETNGAEQIDLTIKWVNGLQIRSVYVYDEVSDDIASYGYHTKDDTEMASNIPCKGRHVRQLAKNVDSVMRAPQVRYIGPDGQEGNSNWPANKHLMYPYFTANDSTLGWDWGAGANFYTRKYLQDEGTRIKVKGTFIPIDKSGTPRDDNEFEKVISDDPLSEWTLKCRVRQPENGDTWSSTVHVTNWQEEIYQDFDLYLPNEKATWPFLHQMAWGWYDLENGATSYSDPEYMYNEGQLYDNDMMLQRNFSFILDIGETYGAHVVDFTKPFALEFDASFTAGDDLITNSPGDVVFYLTSLCVMETGLL